MNRLPPFSVIVVTRNRAATLRDTLDRILADDYPDREVVVVDGASTDGTVDLLRSYGDRVRWISEPDRGEYDAWNKATRLARGELIKWLPDDDRLRPGALRAAAAYFEAHPGIDVAFGRFGVLERRDGKDALIAEPPHPDPPRFTPRDWLRHTQGVMSVGAFVRRRAVDRIGPFELGLICGDLEFWTRAAVKGVAMGLIPEVVADYRLTGENLSRVRKRRIAFEVLWLCTRYGTVSDLVYCAERRKYVLLGVEGTVQRLVAASQSVGFRPLHWARTARNRILGKG